MKEGTEEEDAADSVEEDEDSEIAPESLHQVPNFFLLFPASTQLVVSAALRMSN